MAAPPIPDRSSQRSPIRAFRDFVRPSSSSSSLKEKKDKKNMPLNSEITTSPRASSASSSSSPSFSPDKLLFARTPLPPALVGGRPMSEFTPESVSAASGKNHSTLRHNPRPSTSHRVLSIAPSMSIIRPRNILIAGANGRKASLLINSLLSTPSFGTLKILSFSERGDADARKSYPSVPKDGFFMADCIDVKLFRQALLGIDVLFYNPPAHQQDWVPMVTSIMTVAKECNVGHFILYSILHPQLTKLIHHNDRLKAEEYLIESGLNYTIVQPGVPMQNVDVRTIVSTGQYCLPYPHSTLQSFVDIHDIALVIRKIILNPEPHNRAIYELVGQTCTHEDIARDIANYSNKGEEGIECIRIDRSQFVGNGGDEYETDVLERVLLYYERRGVTGNPNVLRWILGRSPTTFSVMLHRDYQVAEYQEFIAE